MVRGQLAAEAVGAAGPLVVRGQLAAEAVGAAGPLVERGSGRKVAAAAPEELEPTEARGRSIVGGMGGEGDERCERQAAVGAEVAWRDAGGGEQRKGDGGAELVRLRKRDVGHGHGEGAEMVVAMARGGRLHGISVREGGAEGKGMEEEDARDGEAAENVTECDFR